MSLLAQPRLVHKFSALGVWTAPLLCSHLTTRLFVDEARERLVWSCVQSFHYKNEMTLELDSAEDSLQLAPIAALSGWKLIENAGPTNFPSHNSLSNRIHSSIGGQNCGESEVWTRGMLHIHAFQVCRYHWTKALGAGESKKKYEKCLSSFKLLSTESEWNTSFANIFA